MSAANGIDAANPGKQTLTRFDHYADLPAELRIKIIREFMAYFRKPPRLGKMAPLAAVHSEWRHELEPEKKLWGSLRLTTNDLPTYRSLLNQRRGDSLFRVILEISINQKVVDPDQQGYDAISHVEIRSRASEWVVRSLSTVFELVDRAKSMSPQPARQGVELDTQIRILPWHDMRMGERQNILHDIQFDFSPLPPTIAIRGLSQRCLKFGVRPSSMILLNRSSLLSLAARTPNLRCASISLDPMDRISAATTPQVNICPKLQNLIVKPKTGLGLPGSFLSSCISNWSHNIEWLRLGNTTNMPEFFRSLPTPAQGTSTITWPNLQVLEIKGWYRPALDQVSRADELHDILSATATALISLPRMKDLTINLACHFAFDPFIFPEILVTLKFRGESTELIISTTNWYSSSGGIIQRPGLAQDAQSVFREQHNIWKVISEEAVRPAIAELHAVVRTQHGQDLKVVLPEKDDAPDSP